MFSQVSAFFNEVGHSTKFSLELWLKNRILLEVTETWHTGTTFDAESEYRIEKIVRPISRELLAIFYFLTCVRIFVEFLDGPRSKTAVCKVNHLVQKNIEITLR